MTNEPTAAELETEPPEDLGRLQRIKHWSGSALTLRRVNGWLTIFWIIMIPVSIEVGWIDSVAYVSALSLWALVSGHWSAWQAARVEVKQAQEHREREAEDIPGETVERLVEKTEINEVVTTEEGNG